MVALVVLALGCGDGQALPDGGALDAGADAETTDVAVVDLGPVGQCDGMPDLSPCDDGQGHTTDACIGGVCVGRTCSAINTRCNTRRLTVEGCEGVPANDGATCDDRDAFTRNDECRAGACVGAPCACPEGPCCNATCGFREAGAECARRGAVTCQGRCGAASSVVTTVQACTGTSGACDGVVTSDRESGTCPANYICEPGEWDGSYDDRFGCFPSLACN